MRCHMLVGCILAYALLVAVRGAPVQFTCYGDVVINVMRNSEGMVYMQLLRQGKVVSFVYDNAHQQFVKEFEMLCSASNRITYNADYRDRDGFVLINDEQCRLGQINEDEYRWEAICNDNERMFFLTRSVIDPKVMLATLGFQSEAAYAESRFESLPHMDVINALEGLQDCSRTIFH